MAHLEIHAEPVTADGFSMKTFRAGIRKSPPGMLLSDILTISGGKHEGVIDLSPELQEHFRRVAALSGDGELAGIADAGRIVIPLDEFEGSDPETTRISFGFTLNVTPEES